MGNHRCNMMLNIKDGNSHCSIFKILLILKKARKSTKDVVFSFRVYFDGEGYEIKNCIIYCVPCTIIQYTNSLQYQKHC